jgi:hypothetical protein
MIICCKRNGGKDAKANQCPLYEGARCRSIGIAQEHDDLLELGLGVRCIARIIGKLEACVLFDYWLHVAEAVE